MSKRKRKYQTKRAKQIKADIIILIIEILMLPAFYYAAAPAICYILVACNFFLTCVDLLFTWLNEEI